MENKKETIDNLKKINAFDNAYDPLVLEINPEEREKLAKSLENTAQEMSLKEDDDFDTSGKKKKKKAKKTEKKVSFFTKIINFFKNIFSEIGGSGSGFSSKDLKKIKAALTDFEIPILDFNKKRIKESFASYIYDIYRELKELHLLFEEAYLENSEINIAEPVFFIRYISNLLSDDVKVKLQIFTNEYIAKLIDTERNPMVLLKTELQGFENTVSINERPTLNRYVEPFERLLTLNSYDFRRFFESFGYKLRNETEKRKKERVFHDAESEMILEDLKKLNDYFRIINFSKLPEEISQNFINTLDSLVTKKEELLEEEDNEYIDVKPKTLDMNPSEEEIDEEYEAASEEEIEEEKTSDNKYDLINTTLESLNRTIFKIYSFNEKNILDYIIQFLSQSSAYKGKMIKVNVFMLDKYINLLKEQAIANFNRLEVLKREEKVTNSILKFFRVRSLNDLSKIVNYNEEMNRQLEKRNVNKFTGVKKAAMMKTFLERVYTQGMENTIKTLLVEGDYIDKSGQQEFSDAVYRIEQKQSDLADFEKMVSDDSDEMTKIRNFIYTAMHDKNVKTVAKRKINEIDEVCDKMVTDFVVQLNIIYNFLDKCITDSKSSRPIFIYNMKNIGASNNRLFMNNIYKSFEILKAYLDITKNFVLVHNRVQ